MYICEKWVELIALDFINIPVDQHTKIYKHIHYVKLIYQPNSCLIYLKSAKFKLKTSLI